MKLWLKQTLVTLAVILLSVSMCLYHFVAQETDQLIQQAIQSGARDTAVFCDHLSTLERTSTAYDMDIITRQALIQYTFSTYAHLLQTGDCTASTTTTRRRASQWKPCRWRRMPSPPAASSSGAGRTC